MWDKIKRHLLRRNGKETVTATPLPLQPSRSASRSSPGSVDPVPKIASKVNRDSNNHAEASCPGQTTREARSSKNVNDMDVMNCLFATSAPMYPRNSYDIFYAAFLLRQLVPQDLVRAILDEAMYWLRALLSLRREIRELRITDSDTGYCIVSRSIPRPVLSHHVRMLRVEVESKDQGFSWDTQWHGTYEHSWTWFDLRIDDETVAWASPAVVEPLVMRERIITNRHAGKDFELQRVVWRWDDPVGGKEEEIRKFLRNLQGGRCLSLTAHAQFEAWENFVKYARMEVFVQPVTRG